MLESLIVLVLTISSDEHGHADMVGGKSQALSYTVFDDMEACEAARPFIQIDAMRRTQHIRHPSHTVTAECIDIARR